jgi:predicted alpha/beta-hydrolase family hydrolase
MSQIEPIAEKTTPPVRGFLHRPEKAAGAALVLTHGAGGNCNAALLVALADAFAHVGWAVLRCDLPYRQLRPTGPPRGSGSEDREGLRRAVEFMRKETRRAYLGGMSYGGRQATMLVAEDPRVCDGLLVLSYPLHPPGKPEQQRTKHLPQIKGPALFVSGDKDPFGAPAELEAAVRLVPTHPQLLIVEKAGHDLGYGRRAKTKAGELPALIRDAFLRDVAR